MNKCFTDFVGVIDSGVGGLTVLKQLQKDFPNCNFVYIADSAYCPYGTKQPSEILRRAETLVKYLQDNNAQAAVIACNTASVYADTLRQKFSLPIYDVITPTCRLVAKTTQTKRVALLATNATVKSCAYQQLLNESEISVVSFPCSSFVPFVEANAVDTSDCEVAVATALSTLPKCNVDTVILGCTHFPILKSKIAPYTHGANIIECFADLQFPVMDEKAASGVTAYFTTGRVEQANRASQWFGKINFSHIDL